MKMREIKFRSAHYNFDGSFNRFTYWGPTRHGFKSPSSITGTTVKCHEQYTGIHDINGKPIYEGDIVKRINPINEFEPETIGVVTYDSDAMFVIGDGYTFERFPEGITFEVIGNIHENNPMAWRQTVCPYCCNYGWVYKGSSRRTCRCHY